MASPTFVFINDFGGFSVLADHLPEVISSMVQGNVTHAVIALGYWDFSGGQVYVSDGATRGSYQHPASFYTNIISQMHAAGLQVIAWMMDGAAYDPSFGQVNLNIQYLPLYLPYVKQIMDMGFDGFCDDIEYWLWTDEGYWLQWSTWENQLAQYLHNGNNFADGRPRISCPAIGPYNNIAGGDSGDCIGETLLVDYNLVMFYTDENDSSTESLWYLEMLGQYMGGVAPLGESEYPANPFTPLSPVVLVLLVHGGVYDVGSGLDLLGQVSYYAGVVSRHPVGMLGGFGIWVWENMNYVDIEVARPISTVNAYWNAWNTFVTSTLPALGVPEYSGGGFAVSADGPYTFQVGVPVQFSGYASGGVSPYSWLWDFGDGSTSTLQNPTHAYASAGSFNVTLTVTDSSPATKTAYTTASSSGGTTATLRVESQPISGISITITEVF